VNGCGGFGIMASFMDYGTFQGRDATGAPTAPYTANEVGLMAGWGMECLPGFFTGLSLRENQQFNPNQTYGVFSGGLGVLFLPDSHLRLGAALIDFGPSQDAALVASTLEVGASYSQMLGKAQGLLLALDGTLEFQGVNRLGIGAEYAYQSKYFLRAGYQFSDQNDEIEDLQGFTAGAGLRLGDFQLDYAYLPYGDLGNSQRISLSYFFPAPPASNRSAEQIPASNSPPASFKPNPGAGTNQSVLTLQFELPPDLVAQGQALEAQGQMVQAMRLYEEELSQNSQDAAAWYYLGADYYKLNQKANAVQCFEQVLKWRPNDKAFSDWLEKYKESTP
jgi:tetratricopeptide (TPR) repeat protein